MWLLALHYTITNPMKPGLFRLWPALLMPWWAGCSDDDPQINPAGFVNTPAEIEIVTSDIDLFWEVHDQSNGVFVAGEFLDNYFRSGTESLSQFFDAKIKNAQPLANLLSDEAYHNYYLSIRANTENINTGELLEALQLFENQYPPAVFSDLVMVVGPLRTGGTVVSNGNMVIGVEFFTKAPDTPTSELSPWVEAVTRTEDYLSSIVLHELVHVQQRNFAVERNLSGSNTLLEIAMAEGIADFVPFILIGKYPNDHLPAFADPIEEDLWNEFKGEMNGTDLDNWLFNGANSPDRPGDLGYYIGFKIAQYFYDNMADKEQATRELLEILNAEEFLDQSGYEDKFN